MSVVVATFPLHPDSDVEPVALLRAYGKHEMRADDERAEAAFAPLRKSALEGDAAAMEELAAHAARWGRTRSSANACADAAQAVLASQAPRALVALRRRGSPTSATAIFREALEMRRGEGGALASPALVSKTLHALVAGEFPIFDKASRAALGISLEGGLSTAAAFRLLAQWEYAFLREPPESFDEEREKLGLARLAALDKVLTLAWDEWTLTHR